MSVHVFYGHAKREPEPEDNCLYCDAHEEVMAYTYFGGPVCGRCWDGRWRQEEDGKTDPPFAKITRRVSGEWLTASNPAKRQQLLSDREVAYPRSETVFPATNSTPTPQDATGVDSDPAKEHS